MADQTTPNTANQQWFLNPPNISQAPFLQSWNGVPAPFANTQDQIQQSLVNSGVYPGQMPYNGAMGNTAARYAFGRSVPGTSPAVGSLTNFMQNYSGQNPQTGVNLGLLGNQVGSPGAPTPGVNVGNFTPQSPGYSPGTYPAPGGYSGNPNVPGPGSPAPPFPPISDPAGPGVGPPGGPGQGGPLPRTPPGAGQSNRGSFNTGMWNGTGGLLGGNANRGAAPQSQQQLAQTGMQALQGVTDPAMRYMIANAYHIAPASVGLTNEQINALQQSTMGSVYNRKTGQVQNGVY
jgi:hypothetical protein